MDEENKKPVEETTVESTPAGAESDIKQQLEAEQALRALAEEERDNAKKDIIAMKTGRKRGEVDLKQAEQNPPAAAPATDSQAIAAALAESQRINAELARALASRGVPTTSGAGVAESPAPKPKGYWSEEQKAVLKKRGWSDDKISRAERTAQMGSATSPKLAQDAGVQKRPY